MPLKLRIISDHYKQLGKTASQLFGVHGGLIGRAPDNDWILPDPDRYISSHHAKVSFHAGTWILEDLSTNGVFVNEQDSPISVTGPHKLKDGDRLRLGDYDVLVSIDDRNDFSADSSGQMRPPPGIQERRAPKPTPPPAPTPMSYARQGRRTSETQNDIGEDLGEDLDITGMFVTGHREADTSADAVAAFDRAQADRSLFTPNLSPKNSTPPPTLLDDVLARVPGPTHAAATEQPEDWHMSTRRVQKSKPGTTPEMDFLPTHSSTPKVNHSPTMPLRDAPPFRTEPERLRRGGDGHSELHAGVDALCRGAGIDPSVLPTDAYASLLHVAGQMLREVVLDLMEALRSRGDHKNDLRLSQTNIQAAQNNPLKFSVGVDEALRKLLDGHGSSNRYLGPVEALREAFNDLRNHQLAIDTAMHIALNDLLARVDPTQLQERFDRGQKRNPLLPAVSKGKYWDLYTEFYPLLNQRDARGWPAVFTEEFGRAYADKVEALENQKKGR